MQKNMGTTDRILRIVAAIAIAILYFTNVISGPFAIALGLLAVILMVTSLIGFCPIYGPFGIRTCKKKN